MPTWEEFEQGELRVATADFDETTGRILRFGSLIDEYRVIRNGAALVDRNYVSVLEISGTDRASWLHNLTTNQVKNLGRQEGVYAFALNVQGRILFDLQVLNVGESLWCVINKSFLEKAVKHFDRYVITEDVMMTNRAAGLVRLGLSGPRISTVLEPFGLGNAGAMASLNMASCVIAGTNVTVIRNDFCGVPGVDLYVMPDSAAAVWSELVACDRETRAIPIGDAVVEIARIEAGLPCPLREITDDVLPAETGQFDRAVSYTKGCYLGQEIVERMRSRGVVAKMLSGLIFEGESCPPVAIPVLSEQGTSMGTLTSTCFSLALNAPIGLAYLKHGSAKPETRVRVAWNNGGVDREITGRVVPLPFIGAAAH